MLLSFFDCFGLFGPNDRKKKERQLVSNRPVTSAAGKNCCLLSGSGSALLGAGRPWLYLIMQGGRRAARIFGVSDVEVSTLEFIKALTLQVS